MVPYRFFRNKFPHKFKDCQLKSGRPHGLCCASDFYQNISVAAGLRSR